MVQENGEYSGRLLADGKLVPQPKENDANRAGDDGWLASFAGSKDALRVEVGPIPVDADLSVFKLDYVRYFELDARPGVDTYRFDPLSVFSGEAAETLVPVKSRLGPVWRERAYLTRESRGRFLMGKNPSKVVAEEVPLEDAE